MLSINDIEIILENSIYKKRIFNKICYMCNQEGSRLFKYKLDKETHGLVRVCDNETCKKKFELHFYLLEKLNTQEEFILQVLL